MKMSIERATLLKALGHVQNVVERRNTIPILSKSKQAAPILHYPSCPQVIFPK